MTQFLPPNLLALFAPRPPIPYLPPSEHRSLPPYTGISQYLQQFETPDKTPPGRGYAMETKKQVKERLRSEKRAKYEEKLQQHLAECM